MILSLVQLRLASRSLGRVRTMNTLALGMESDPAFMLSLIFWKFHILFALVHFSAYSGYYHFYFLFPPTGSKWLFCSLLCPQRPPSVTQECGVCAWQQRLHGRNQTPAGERQMPTFSSLTFAWDNDVHKIQLMPNVCFTIQLLLPAEGIPNLIQLNHWHKRSFQHGGFREQRGVL